MRASMAPLVDHLRMLTNAAHTDVFHDTVFWTDGQLLDVLERTRTLDVGLPLSVTPYRLEGSSSRRLQYTDLGRSYWIEPEAAIVRNAEGFAVSTPFVVRREPTRVVIEFQADPPDGQLYLEVWVYDMNDAAAEVWEIKAAQRHDFIQTSAGGHKFRFEDDYAHCVGRANYYRSKKIRSFSFRRGGFIPQSRRRP